MKSYTGTGYTIYAHINKVNGKMYIGQPRQIKYRKRRQWEKAYLCRI